MSSKAAVSRGSRMYLRKRATSSSSPKTAEERGIAEGYRSGLEVKVAESLARRGVEAEYEQHKIHYTVPSRKTTYTPDFILPNGIIIETKGEFKSADRQKHKHIKAEHPHLDIRFVFSNPNTRISKQSATTYAAWCTHHGFKYAAKDVPDEWLTEQPNNQSEL